MGRTAASPMTKLAAHHWSYEDYLRLPDDGMRCEIIEGERIMTPAPWSRHQRVSIHLASALLRYVERHDLGLVFCAPFDVILADDTVVQPDIVVISREHRSRVKESGLFGAPYLAVEILSPSTQDRDLRRKMRGYARHGVREYWVVDPDEQRVLVHVLERGRYAKKAELPPGPARSLAVLPGFAVRLADIFKT